MIFSFLFTEIAEEFSGIYFCHVTWIGTGRRWVDMSLWPNKIMLSKHMHGQKLNQIQIEQKKGFEFFNKNLDKDRKAGFEFLS